ncbi:MAG: DNA internalization-related competence protein ComEC/Rec2, partial [Clostridia bacterium]|nr:DNA internalization-related competence protein ComEC/Rec2 [Clostridia bacterium]
MRRKCFFVFLLLVFLIVLFDWFGVNLLPTSGELLMLEGEQHEYRFKVVKYRVYDKRISLTCRVLGCDGRDIKTRGKILLNCYTDEFDQADFLYSEIIFKGTLEVPKGKRNPHCFDYRKYLLSTGVLLTGTAKKVEICEIRYNIPERYIRYLHKLKLNFTDELLPDSKGLICGLLFGETAYMDDDIYSSFQSNGTSHILAVSGLHITVIYDLLEKIGKRRKKGLRTAFTVAALLSYGFLCMWSISIIRAVTMIIMKIVAREFDLRYDTLTSVSAVGILLSLSNPYVVFNTGFQISFLAVISISVLSGMLDKIPGSIRTSLAVTLGIIGYQAYVFNYISPLSVLVNIPIILLASYTVPASLFAFLVISVSGTSEILLRILDRFAYLIIWINRISTIEGVSSINITGNMAISLILISVVLFTVNSEYVRLLYIRGSRRMLKKTVVLIISALVFLFAVTYDPITYCDIVFIDVGQGDSTHIKAGSMDILIDGGGQMTYNVGEKTLKPYLLKNNAKDIDLCLLTHTHADHYKGIQELGNVYKIKETVTDSIKGDVFRISKDVYIETIWPNSKSLSKDENKNCSVYIVNYKGYRIMITGDLDKEGEKLLLSEYPKEYLRCDILKIGHHGSDTSTSDEFLNAVSPEYAVIQVGKNGYGHPKASVIKQIKEHHIVLFRNDKNGAV